MRRVNVALLVLLGILVVAGYGTLRAQSDPYESSQGSTGAATVTTISGTLVSQGPGALIVKTDDGMEMTFTLDPGVVLPEGLQQGSLLTLDYQSLEGGTYQATHVALVSSTGPTPTATEDGLQTGSEQTLPRTASPLPLIVLIGTLLLGAATGLRVLARRDS